MALPVDLIAHFDGSNSSQFTLYGCAPQNGYRVDTAGLGAQAVLANQPTWDTRAIAAGRGLIFGGSGAPLFSQPSWLTAASIAFQIPVSIMLLVRCDGTATPIEWSTNASSSTGVRLRSDTSPTLTITGPGGTGTWNAAAGWLTGNGAHLVWITTDGTLAGTKINLDGVNVTLTSSGTAPGTLTLTTVPAVWGADHTHTGEPMTGAIGFSGLVPGRVVSGAEITASLAYVNTPSTPFGWYLPTPGATQTRNFISCGDSISAGHGTAVGGTDTQLYSYSSRAQSILGSRCGGLPTQNYGQDSARLTVDANPVFSVLTHLNTSGIPAIVSGMKNVIILQGGVNDEAPLGQGSFAACQAGAVTIAGYWLTVAAAAVTALHGVSSGGNGNHIVVYHTLTKQGTIPSGVSRALANRILRAQFAAQSVSDVTVIMCDMGADPVLGNTISPSFQPDPAFNSGDTTHPTKPGHEHWGGELARVLLAAGV
jgi:hypothetical protein